MRKTGGDCAFLNLIMIKASEAVYGNNTHDINQTLENIVYMELLRRDYRVCVCKSNVNEIDFIAVLVNEKIYIQVAYLLSAEETVDREFSVLETIPDNYHKLVFYHFLVRTYLNLKAAQLLRPEVLTLQ